MRHALSENFSITEDEWEFIDRPHFIPEIKNLPKDIHFSLSHSNGLICFAISDSPIGVDLEAIEERNYYELAKIFMNKEELDLLESSTVKEEDFFYRTWCAKEAYYKSLSLSEQAVTDFRDISISDLRKIDKNPFLLEWQPLNIEIDQLRFILSVVTKNKMENISYNNFPSSLNLTTPVLINIA